MAICYNHPADVRIQNIVFFCCSHIEADLVLESKYTLRATQTIERELNLMMYLLYHL